jgi:hypothetical protein
MIFFHLVYICCISTHSFFFNKLIIRFVRATNEKMIFFSFGVYLRIVFFFFDKLTIEFVGLK